MKVLPGSVTDSLTVVGHRVGWAAVRRMPERVAYALFDRIADLTVARGGAARMRSNYAKVRPDLDDAALDALVRDGMRRYLRYYCEAFRLQDLTADDLAQRVRAEGDGPVREVIEGGGSVIAFLGHLGNWDLAGAWGTTHLGPVTTVAERLKPEEVFEEFLAFRESLGMTIIPLTGGATPSRRCARPPAGPASSPCSPTVTSPPTGSRSSCAATRPGWHPARPRSPWPNDGRCTRSPSATSGAAAGGASSSPSTRRSRCPPRARPASGPP